MTAATKVLVIGGYGVFGGRLVQLLEDEPRLSLVVAGRSADHAGALVRSRGNTAAALTPIAFDRNGDLAGCLAAIRPDIVVDASGPFQAYGTDRYRVVRACVAQRINYLDLADGSDFVAGIGAFDAQAKTAGIYVLSGVSSFPVLTAAAVRRLSTGMAAVTAIRGGVAPSPYAGVGENVIRAIAGYAGKPIRRKSGGAFGTGYPWTEHLRYTVAVPGLVPLATGCCRWSTYPICRRLRRFGRRRKRFGWARHPFQKRCIARWRRWPGLCVCACCRRSPRWPR